jgi:hypothetical protein
MKIPALFRTLAGRPFLIAAGVIVFLFVIAQFCGLRETTNILSGTVSYDSMRQLLVFIYLALYCGVVILAPILLITFVIINVVSLVKRLFYKMLDIRG